jgi:hypothetical protein
MNILQRLQHPIQLRNLLCLQLLDVGAAGNMSGDAIITRGVPEEGLQLLQVRAGLGIMNKVDRNSL